MVHPSEIMRANSAEGSRFSAPITRRTNDVDCGWTALPCLAEKLGLERWATAGTFLGFLALLGFLQGATLTYFRGTAHIWMQHYQYTQTTIDWLLYSNELFVGIFALLISYWGNRIHRVSWLGGLTIFQAFASLMLIIPETHEPHVNNFLNRSVTDFLCARFSGNFELVGEFNYIAIGVLFLFQLLFAFATISFYTLGISYVDDNIEKDNAPTYLAIAMAAKIFGKQFGLYLSWIPALTNKLTIFTTPMWLVLSALTFIFGAIITLFPKSLPAVALKKAVASLLSLADGDDPEEVEEKHDGFFVILWRLLRNPVLMMNIGAATFMAVAFVNLDLFQNKFFQSRFFVQVGPDLSGYQDNIISKITNIIKYPFLGTSLIATGFMVAKLKPKPKFLAMFNVTVYAITALSFISFAFLSCDVALESEFHNRLTTPLCSSHCLCPRSTPFMPVCTVEGQNTYFSPCHAGCSSVSFSNMKIYSNCTCGANILQITNTAATEGSCQRNRCSLLFGVAQAAIITSTSGMIATVVTNIIINLRVILPGDKAMALALESTLLGILPYVPGKIIFSAVADSLCRYWGSDRCLLNSKSFGLFFWLTIIVLIGIGGLLSVGVVLSIGDVELWSKRDSSSTPSDYEQPEENEDLENRRSRQVNDTDEHLDFRLRTAEEPLRNRSEEQNQNRRNQRQAPRGDDDMLESAF